MKTKDRAEYHREWYDRNVVRIRAQQDERRAGICSAVATLKLEAGCVDCGYDEHPEALDFDHVLPGKTSSVSHLSASASIERVLAEVALCAVRCANCHRVATAGRRAA